MKRVNIKETVESQIYETLLRYEEYLDFIDYAEKNGYTDIDYIQDITERVSYVNALYADSDIYKTLDYTEVTILDYIMDRCSVDDIIRRVDLLYGEDIDYLDIKLIIKSISQKLVDITMRVHNEQEDLQVATVN